jgi:hypothetical protein
VCQLLDQKQAVGKRYIIDETTAIVRFIIPLQSTAHTHGDTFEPAVASMTESSQYEQEVSLVRNLFFTLFAEVVVHSVQGEDQIWLIEHINGTQRLYTWEVTNSG